MKKTLFFLVMMITLILMASLVVAKPVTFNLYSSTASGVTTIENASTNLVIEGDGMIRTQGTTVLANTDGRFGNMFSIQLVDIDTYLGLSVDSGATFTIRWQGSDLSGATAFASADYHDIVGLNSIALSGVTKIKRTFTVDKSQFIRFSLLSGVTPFKNAQFQLRTSDEWSDNYNDKPVYISSETIWIPAANSGTTYALTVPVGTYIASMQSEGGPMRFVLDASTPSDVNDKFLSSGDWYTFWSRSEIDGFRATRSSGGSGVSIYVDYFGSDK